jgi:indolepyruvate ferredoxin oxidoreductase
MHAAIEDAIDGGPLFDVAASELATELMGDSIGTNILMLGYAAQKGLLPLTIASLEQAIRLNGTFVEGNLRTFALGRLAAHAPEILARELHGAAQVPLATVDEVLASRMKRLTAYQDARYAQDYGDFVNQVRRGLEARQLKGRDADAFVRQVALTLGRLMAYKDEYEVARLYTDPAFMQQVREQFSGDFAMTLHLAPPTLPGRDDSGRPKKRAFGAWWTLRLFKVLARLKGLRGTAFDPFGYSTERRMERRLIADYRALIERVVAELTASNLKAGADLAAAAADIAGYGPVKDAAVAEYQAKLPALLQAFQSAATQSRAA